MYFYPYCYKPLLAVVRFNLQGIFNLKRIKMTVLTQEHNYDLICEKWDEYQEENNSESENEPCIYDFVSKGNWDFCEVLDVDFYQPSYEM